jgi:hypothetical protein
MEKTLPDQHDMKTLNVVTSLLLLTILMVISTIGLLYYLKVDYYLPPALILMLIPLISQLHAASSEKSRLRKLKLMQKRAESITKSEDRYLIEPNN